MQKLKPHSEKARELIQQYPEHGNHTIAKMVFDAFGGAVTHEQARSSVRFWRGASGKHHRSFTTTPDATVKCERARSIALPEPAKDGADWVPVRLRARKVLVLSDLHIPYHDKRAAELAIQAGLDADCDAVLLNGDFMDFYGISSHERDPRQRKFIDEIEMGREILGILRQAFAGKQVWWKLGNHEERWERWMWQRAPEIVGIPEFETEHWMHTDKYNVRVIRDQLPIRVNKLTILHGHEYRWTMASPVNAARGMFLRARVPVLSGHQHQSSEHTETDLHDKICTCWSSGCLMNLHPRYSRINPKWNLGFAIVDTTGEDDFTVHNKRIWDGRIL